MEQTTIPLSELPVLSPNIKRAICMFVWSLYAIENKDMAQYLLRTQSERFLLREDGKIIRKVTNDDEKFIIRGQVYFIGYEFSFNTNNEIL